jgi:uncharacterized protein
MKIFVDTSAFFALLDRDDLNHPRAKKIWQKILEGEIVLVTTNYILIECFALIQNRLGMEAVRAFQADVSPMLAVEFVNAETHRAGVSAMLAAARRKLSLVDCVSFEIIRTNGIEHVFAFDPHFGEQGFHNIQP